MRALRGAPTQAGRRALEVSRCERGCLLLWRGHAHHPPCSHCAHRSTQAGCRAVSLDAVSEAASVYGVDMHTNLSSFTVHTGAARCARECVYPARDSFVERLYCNGVEGRTVDSACAPARARRSARHPGRAALGRLVLRGLHARRWQLCALLGEPPARGQGGLGGGRRKRMPGSVMHAHRAQRRAARSEERMRLLLGLQVCMWEVWMAL